MLLEEVTLMLILVLRIKMPGCVPRGNNTLGNLYVEATNYFSLDDKYQKLAIYLEGLELFEKIFGYKSETIIPPNYTWV